MGNRLTKIYTRTGDDGTTGLANGNRASKADLTFVVMGDVDELNAHIGMVAAQVKTLKQKSSKPANSSLNEILNSISVVQHLLFNVGGELAMPEFKGIKTTHITWLENEIDMFNNQLLPLKDFILPAGSILVSQTHIARTVCRRAERQAVNLKSNNNESISENVLKLLNRLSDWLFVLSRFFAKIEGSNEVLWDKAILEKFT